MTIMPTQKTMPALSPIIAIDGPSASGKGTIAQLVADRLGFHYLDSGALYRVVAFATHQHHIAWSDAIAVAKHATTLKIQFKDSQIYLNHLQYLVKVDRPNLNQQIHLSHRHRHRQAK